MICWHIKAESLDSYTTERCVQVAKSLKEIDYFRAVANEEHLLFGDAYDWVHETLREKLNGNRLPGEGYSNAAGYFISVKCGKIRIADDYGLSECSIALAPEIHDFPAKWIPILKEIFSYTDSQLTHI